MGAKDLKRFIHTLSLDKKLDFLYYFVVTEESLEVCRYKMGHKVSAFVHLSLCHGQQMRSNMLCGAGAQVSEC